MYAPVTATGIPAESVDLYMRRVAVPGIGRPSRPGMFSPRGSASLRINAPLSAGSAAGGV